MSRNWAALGAVLVVGVLLWLVMAWDGPSQEPAAWPEGGASGSALLAPQPYAAGQPEPLRAPVAVAEPEPAAEPIEAAPPLAAEEEVQTRADGTRMPSEQIKGDQGPVAEYRAKYESEPRDYAAGEVESLLRKSFLDSADAAELIKSVSCRETICKMEMRWKMERMRSYIAGVNRVGKSFKLPLALSPVSPADGRGIRLVEVYMMRKPPGSDGPIEPLHRH
jgi:hypothetical protein